MKYKVRSENGRNFTAVYMCGEVSFMSPGRSVLQFMNPTFTTANSDKIVN